MNSLLSNSQQHHGLCTRHEPNKTMHIQSEQTSHNHDNRSRRKKDNNKSSRSTGNAVYDESEAKNDTL